MGGLLSRLVGALAAGAVLGACASDDPRPLQPRAAVLDPNPSVRTEAALAYGRGAGPESTARLLILLEDPDPTVRMVAHRSLEQATGTRSSFSAFAPAAERRAAIALWREELGVPADPAMGAAFDAAPPLIEAPLETPPIDMPNVEIPETEAPEVDGRAEEAPSMEEAGS